MADQKIKVTLNRSLICQKPKLRKTAEALGLKRPNQSVLLPYTADVRGMLKVVEHMIAVEPA
ncbi:MAG: 50S ribosomal protein L30 [Armatimonadetes bacterium]|nr:50S ribosomal protein L30 [Armatimonadota bacterium]